MGIFSTQPFEAVADTRAMPPFVHENKMPAPFFQCPVCRGTDVIAAVEAPTSAVKFVTFHPRCRGCGFVEHGALVEEHAHQIPEVFSRWLHPRRRTWSSPLLDPSPCEWTCTVCGSAQVAFDDYECHECGFCGTRRFRRDDELAN